MNSKKYEKKLERAMSLRSPVVFDNVTNCYFVPTWCGEHKFFYAHESIKGAKKQTEYLIVNCENGEKTPLFDHKILAKKLSEMLKTEVEPYALPIKNMQKVAESVYFDVSEMHYKYENETLTKLGKVPKQALVLSPDGKYGAYTKAHNLYIKNMQTGTETRLTHDGVKHNAYAGIFEGNENVIREKLLGFVRPAAVLWSPDSKKLLTYKMDERKVKELHLVQNVTHSGDMRPVLHSYKYALPGDTDIPMAQLYICDVEKGVSEKADVAPLFIDLSEPLGSSFRMAEWSDDSTKIALFRMDRQHKNVDYYILDALKNVSRLLDQETTDTFLFFDFYRARYGGDMRYDKNAGKPMWFEQNKLYLLSDIDGYFHIYCYDTQKAGKCEQMTRGEWNVRQILRVTDSEIYFTAAGVEDGSSPYYMKAYVLKRGENILLLTPDEREHIVQLSPDGKYIVDNTSRPDEPPMVVLRSADGKYISTVAQADTQKLDKIGVSYPMPCITRDESDKYDVYGLMVLPYDFDPKKKYPVIDYYYGGNQTTNVPTNFYDFLNRGLLSSLSELGFAVVIFDGRGTPFRSREYHNYCHKNMGECCGLPDHVCGIKQLCEKYEFMDTNRIGVWGHSGGGFAAYKCMVKHPELYKAAVSSGGNHMQELYINAWSERFMNDYDKELWAAQNSENEAENMTGKMFLVHGELDDNVHPANTMRIVDALIRAERDFEFLLMPGKHHMLSDDAYYTRRVLDFFVRNML